MSYTRTTRSGVKRYVDPNDLENPIPPWKRSRPNKKKRQPQASTKNEGKDDSNNPSRSTEMAQNDKASDFKPDPSKTPTALALTESTGDIFSAPKGTLLIHACNTEGSWGAGIAKAFKDRYPTAFTAYTNCCRKFGVGKSLLIPPKDESGHFIGCLFTSRSKGKKKDSPEEILRATGPAMRDLLRQVGELDGEEQVGEVWMCKINSGLFGVKWEETKKVLEGIDVGEGGVSEVKVVSREE